MEDLRKFRVRTAKGTIATAQLPVALVDRACALLGGIEVVGPRIRALATQHQGPGLSESVRQDLLTQLTQPRRA
jgi:hypothetical protein